MGILSSPTCVEYTHQLDVVHSLGPVNLSPSSDIVNDMTLTSFHPISMISP